MINFTFPLLNFIDNLLRETGLPLFLVVTLWGIVTGLGVMALYGFISPQKRIAENKAYMRELQARLKSPSLKFSQVITLSKQNILLSFKYLALVIGPSLLASAPALVLLLWMATFYTYSPIEPGDSISFILVPQNKKMTASYIQGKDIVINSSGGAIYNGQPFLPPVDTLYKKQWYNIFYENSGGYLRDDSNVNEVRFTLKRLRLFGSGPEWAVTWELTYVLALLVGALFVKIRYKVH